MSSLIEKLHDHENITAGYNIKQISITDLIIMRTTINTYITKGNFKKNYPLIRKLKSK